MIELLKSAKQLVKRNKVKRISERMWEVEKHLVVLKVKVGRNLLSCSCQNHSRFCNEQSYCSHKLASIIFEANKDLYQYLKEITDETKKNKELKLECNNLMLLDILEKIRKI